VSTTAATQKSIRSTIPARLDRMSWSPFHTRMVAGLGAAWILDGLQITIASSVTGDLVKPATLGMSSTEVGFTDAVARLRRAHEVDNLSVLDTSVPSIGVVTSHSPVQVLTTIDAGLLMSGKSARAAAWVLQRAVEPLPRQLRSSGRAAAFPPRASGT
jgi:hypothetical protein